ncbi:MAG: hypothetical protein QM500_09635, partial [Methylococcales bacterium]
MSNNNLENTSNHSINSITNSQKITTRQESLLKKSLLVNNIVTSINYNPVTEEGGLNCNGALRDNIADKNGLIRNEPLTEINPLTEQGASLRNEKILNNEEHVLDKYKFIKGKPLSDDELKTLFQLNVKYAHVTVGGKHKIVSTKPCPVDGKSLHIESLSEFKNYFLSDAKIAGVNAGEAWLAWKGKVFKPDGISFYPN